MLTAGTPDSKPSATGKDMVCTQAMAELQDLYDVNDPMLPRSVTLDREGRVVATSVACPLGRANRDHVYERPGCEPIPFPYPPPFPALPAPDCVQCGDGPPKSGYPCGKCNVQMVELSGGDQNKCFEVAVSRQCRNGGHPS